MEKRKLGDQWVEEIDGERHMLKAVLQPKQQSHLYNGNNTHPCFKCFFQMDDYDCAYPSDKWVCDMQRRVIIKDLGILNGYGCLPEERTGEYPIIKKVVSLELLMWVWWVGIDRKADIAGAKLLIGVEALTKEQAIDAWNRRV